MEKTFRFFVFFLFSVFVSVPIGTSAGNEKGKPAKDPHLRWHSYLGTYVCWDEHFGRSGDDFKDYPNLNFRLEKDDHLIGEFRGIEKSLTAGKNAYYCVFADKLVIKSDGTISFELGERKLYSEPIGFKGKGKNKVGTSFGKLLFDGKISYEEMTLNCKGKECLKVKMVFTRDYP